MKLNEILRQSDYKLDLFSKEAIESLESKITQKADKNGKISFYIPCLVRQNDIRLSPEEVVRQLYLDKLINEYNYPKDRIKVEVAVQKGRDTGEKEGKKRIDILVCDE